MVSPTLSCLIQICQILRHHPWFYLLRVRTTELQNLLLIQVGNYLPANNPDSRGRYYTRNPDSGADALSH